MPKNDADESDQIEQLAGQRRRRVLRGTSAIPSLVTLANGLAGFAAIHFATKPLTSAVVARGEQFANHWLTMNMVFAAWLVFLGMIFDALDGRLARLTRKTSDFGGQLDSLCDAVTFGVAPAILMLRAVQSVVQPTLEVDISGRAGVIGKALWVIAALYVGCAILRLARFNVENEADESAHMSFKGLPSPGAALAVVSLVLLHEGISQVTVGWKASPLLANAVLWAMPVITLASALLMVSSIRYVHPINQYVRGRRPVGYLVWVLFIALAAVAIGLEFALAIGAVAFLLSGPIAWLVRWMRHRRRQERPS